MIRQTFYGLTLVGFTVFWYTPQTFSRYVGAVATWKNPREEPNNTETDEGISGRVRMRLTTECNVGWVGWVAWGRFRRETLLNKCAGGNSINYATLTQWQPQSQPQWVAMRCDASWCDKRATKQNKTKSYWQYTESAHAKWVREIYVSAQWNR